MTFPGRDEIIAAFDGDWDLIQELVPIFQAESRQQMQLITRAVKQGDAASIDTTTHSLRGSLLSLGESPALEILGQLEQEAKRGEFDGMSEIAAKLQADLQSLNSLLATLSPPSANE